MSTNQAETASAQFTLKLVRELSTLIANGENQKAWNTWHMWATPIASLVESQAKRIASLEKALALAQSMIRGGEKMSDTSEKIFRDAFDSNPSHE